MNTKKVILVAEDERTLSDAIKLKLEKNNFEVVTSRTIEDAKKQVENLSKLDAIWLDHYLMGKENGLDFIAWCKGDKNAKCREVPVFVVSNTASPDKIATYMKLGVNKYFVKSNHRLDDIVCEIINNLNSNNNKCEV
jgi:response regulator of citrate/malate metabolism